jgi:hypothetical protein
MKTIGLSIAIAVVLTGLLAFSSAQAQTLLFSGPVLQGDTTQDFVCSVVNVGSAPVSIVHLTIFSPDNSPSSFTSNTCPVAPAKLASGKECHNDVSSLASPSTKPSYCELSFNGGMASGVRALMEVTDNATGDVLLAVPLY